MEDLIKNQGVIAKPAARRVIKALRAETNKVLAEAVAKDPMTKKVHDSYMAFKPSTTAGPRSAKRRTTSRSAAEPMTRPRGLAPATRRARIEALIDRGRPRHADALART
jgi:hypothetical protein